MTPVDTEALALAFGQNLLRLRRLMRLSQEELSVRTGLHRTAIGQIEHGQRVPRIDTLLRLAGALEVEPGDLLQGIVWLPGQRAAPGAFSFASSAGRRG